MNNYDDFNKDSFNTCLSTTMIIDLKTEDQKIIYIIFRPSDEVDKEHSLLAEIFTAYKNYGSPESQFGAPCNYGDEMAVREMVIGNYLNGNLFWKEKEDEYIDNSDYYDGESLDDTGIIKAIETALEDYKNGAIIEAHDNLLAVVDSISEYAHDYGE